MRKQQQLDQKRTQNSKDELFFDTETKHIPKKSLGQNFLRSQRALTQIIEAGNITKNDIIVEIGPGEGVLTEKLLVFAGKVIAIEKDDSLAEKLIMRFASDIAAGTLEVLNQDVLDFDFTHMRAYQNLNYKVIANIPYNITGILIRNILTAAVQPKRMVLLIQKEVADRIVAKDKKHSLLSLSVQVYGKPRIIAQVPPGAFVPAPKVTSAIIAIENISRERFAQPHQEQAFFKAIHYGFAHKRKQLRANMAELVDRTLFESILDELALPHTVRAEDISVDKWVLLVQNLQKNGILMGNE